jgi:hypothetical protein
MLGADMWLPRPVALEVEPLEPIQPKGTTIADAVDLRDRAASALAARLDEPRLHLVAAGPERRP